MLFSLKNYYIYLHFKFKLTNLDLCEKFPFCVHVIARLIYASNFCIEFHYFLLTTYRSGL